jgi:hypothetical protein
VPVPLLLDRLHASFVTPGGRVLTCARAT